MRRGPSVLVALALPMLLQDCALTPAVITSRPDTSGSPAPAMVVLDNHPDAHPHAGLQRADIVFEYLTEGEITRFTAIYFHPQGPDRIEPIRSTRLVTIRIQRAYHGLLFTSGASSYVLSLLRSENRPYVTDQSSGGAYFQRDPNRVAPHNLYTTEDQLRAAVQHSRLRISYVLPAPGTPPGGSLASHVDFAQTALEHVTYVYSQSQHAYEYEWSWNGTFEGPETDSANANRPLMVTNVVIAFVTHSSAAYVEDSTGAHGLDFDLNSHGNAVIFTGGRRIDATWDMSNANAPLRLLDSSGAPLKLPRGLTWIHLVDPGTTLKVS